MSFDRQPGVDEIEAYLSAVVDGQISRSEADRWAGRWMQDEGLDWDEVSWWALDLIHGIDLQVGPEGPFLHDDEQVRGWLEELRKRRVSSR